MTLTDDCHININMNWEPVFTYFCYEIWKYVFVLSVGGSVDPDAG